MNRRKWLISGAILLAVAALIAVSVTTAYLTDVETAERKCYSVLCGFRASNRAQEPYPIHWEKTVLRKLPRNPCVPNRYENNIDSGNNMSYNTNGTPSVFFLVLWQGAKAMSRNIESAACTGVCPCMSSCPIGESLKVIGGKWKMRIICTLYIDGTQRYNDLARKTTGVTNAMLSASLKELEADRIIVRKQYEEIPPRVEYSLTGRGRELWPILHRLAHWAAGEKYDDE